MVVYKNYVRLLPNTTPGHRRSRVVGRPSQLFRAIASLLLPIVLVACNGDSTPVEVTGVDTNAGNGPPTTEQTPAGGETTAGNQNPTAQPQPIVVETGVFIDSPVANLAYLTPSQFGRTNAAGEFRYIEGEAITFAIGGVTLPTIDAKATITPLDIFNAQELNDTSVVNLARLLQTLDEDNIADNGIVIRQNAHDIPDNTSIIFADTSMFEQTSSTAFASAGIDEPLTGYGRALTHLANSLAVQDLVTLSDIASGSLQSDPAGVDRQLPDLDADGVADIFDWDDDGDEVADYIDLFPQDATEAFDFDSDGIGNNADTDDDNDGVVDESDSFPFNAAESADFDQDGYGNKLDTDDDNDGVVDAIDIFPYNPSESLDTDGDGIGNNTDIDDDNDGVNDQIDAFPLSDLESKDSDGDGFGDNIDLDDDNDGLPDVLDAFPFLNSEQRDTDLDGIGNNADNDDDDDGVEDQLDAFSLLFSEWVDTDGDGLGDNFDLDDDDDGAPDLLDAFPLDAAEQLDNDSDGIGNNADTDDDGDGVADSNDAFPLDAGNHTDLDGDGFVDDIDDDNDNDGVADYQDHFPNDATESSDNDGDGIGDNADTDDDNDGIDDIIDALPLNPAEQFDTDADGIGNNADTDDDNDNIPDFADAFPEDPTESDDTDLDGIGNNTDTDDDNDGVPDYEDAFPLNPYEQTDSDNDGVGDNSDLDRDNDGVDDIIDAFPDDPAEHADFDGDGVGDNADEDDDNDGTPDITDPYPNNAYFGDDTDGDGLEDQHDSDDDNDGIPDTLDAFPKDPLETEDFDGDGIGNNSDPDDDGDGVADSDDHAPLDALCSEHEDTAGGVCVQTFTNAIDIVTAVGSTAYLFNSQYSAVVPMDLVTGELLPAIEINSHSTEGVHVAAAVYHEVHNRIYIGFSSGVIVSLVPGELQGEYFHTLSGDASILVPTGNYLTAQARLGNVYSTLDASGSIAGITSNGLRRLSTDTLWSDTDNRLIYFDNNRLTSVTVDQNTGQITASVSTPHTSDHPNSPPLILSPDRTKILTASGSMFSNDTLQWTGTATSDNMTNFVWLADDGLVAVREAGDQSTITRYAENFSIVEYQTTTGLSPRIFYDTGTYFVLTMLDGVPTVYRYVPSSDSDNDLVENIDDAFPTDPAASIDSDGDGAPDEWNTGYSATDSTTGLLLDAYPNDPACFRSEDGNGTQCNYALLIPDVEPDTVIADNNGIVYMLFKEYNLIYRWNLATAAYVSPVYIGSADNLNPIQPDFMVFSRAHDRLYFGYPSGQLTFIELTGSDNSEHNYAIVAEEVTGLAAAGQYIMAVDASGAWNTHYYFDQNGTLTTSADWNRQSSYFAWSEINRRMYFFRDGTSPNDLHYEEISADGLITSSGESPYHGDFTIRGPILLSQDESTVLLGTANYYDSISIERLGSISREFQVGAFRSDGTLAIGYPTSTGGQIAYYDSTLVPLSETVDVEGDPIGLFEHEGTLYVLTYSQIGGPTVHQINN